MADNDVIETMYVAIEADTRGLLAGAKKGVNQVRKDFDGLKKMMGPLGNAFSSIGKSLGRWWEGAQQFGQNIVGAFQRTVPAIRASEVEVSRFDELIRKAGLEGASAMERLTGAVLEQSKATGQTFTGVIDNMKATGQISSEVGENLAKGFEGMTSAVQAGGGALSSILGTLTAIAASAGAEVLIQIFGHMNENAEAAIRFQRSNLQLEIAVRAGQRVMGESIGTIDEWKETIDEARASYRMLSGRDLVEGAAKTVLMTRELGFNKEQMEEVYHAALTLAAVHRIDITRALTLVTQGLTGFGRGLKRYGVIITDAELRTEAARMGFAKSYESLTMEEQALVSLNIVTRQTSSLTQDLGSVMDSLDGRTLAAQKTIANASIKMGNLFAPTLVKMKEGWAHFIEGIGIGVETFSRLLVMFVGGVSRAAATIKALFEGATLEEADAAGIENMNKVMVEFATTLGLIDVVLGDADEEMGTFADSVEDNWGELVGIAERAADEFQDALDTYDEGVKKAAEELAEDIVNINEEAEDDLAAAYADYAKKIAKLEADLAKEQAKIRDKAEDELAKLEEENLDDNEERIREHNLKMQRMEEDHQIEMRRLREQFIQDMWDAISQRDAWAAVQLIRRYAADRKKAEEDYGIKRGRAEEDFELEQRERDENFREKRERILAEEAQELEDQRLAAELKRAELWAELEAERAEIARVKAEETADAQLQYDKQLEQLKQSLDDQMIELAEGLTEEETITAAGAQAVFNALFKTFGVGGDIDRMMDAFEQRVARNVNIRVNVEEAWNPTGGPSPYGTAPGMQTGGAVIARKPTMIEFGEGGPELATFAPLGDVGRLTQETRSMGQIQIDVSADRYFSRDFEADVRKQIVDVLGRVINNV